MFFTSSSSSRLYPIRTFIFFSHFICTLIVRCRNSQFSTIEIDQIVWCMNARVVFMIHLTAWTNMNLGRYFYRCGMYKVCFNFSNFLMLLCFTQVTICHLFIFLHLHSCFQVQGYKKCDHFNWLDEEMNLRANEFIS